MTVKLDTENIRTIVMFQKVTKVHARDVLIGDSCVYFLIDPRMMGLAIGKNGSNIKEIRKIMEKNVKIFGYSRVPEEFIRNMIPKAKSIELSNGSAVITVQPGDKTAVIGKNGENIKAVKTLVKRYFQINHVKLR
jgi:N utilization substance protein A